ncbi:hypothetical protein ICV01_04215 [Polynucleobacter sp. MWH-Spelu-300-X4]|uniref:hypothetical protein n=1 Tax=Polynucleobacter sp. MWH-Spelu-300-X4 TaxID=2689109 RepID=UPI001BFDDB5D|nr:hypothetical protein [Polynucleobacter sp. MWH-Spelu-300-X4]QWD80517.1 hypothetical protein ICV01_04215 [Polynucleobacter sp. MWH-Spelu-300-X4]
MSSRLYLFVGLLVAALIMALGLIWAPNLNTGLAADSANYYLSLAVCAVTPIFFFLSLGRDDTADLNRNSFWRANLSYFLGLQVLLVGSEFYYWIIKTPVSYSSYYSWVMIQYVLLAIIWLAAGQVHHIHQEFENKAAVGGARKNNLQEHIEQTAQTLYQLTKHHAQVKKSIDLLLDELRFLPKFTSQDEFSRLSQLVHHWSSAQINAFQGFDAKSTTAADVLEAFQRETKQLSQKLAQSKSA